MTETTMARKTIGVIIVALLSAGAGHFLTRLVKERDEAMSALYERRLEQSPVGRAVAELRRELDEQRTASAAAAIQRDDLLEALARVERACGGGSGR